MVCFLFITPLAAISGWLCLRGAQDHLHFNSRLEAVGLIALTIALFTIYVLWTLVTLAIELSRKPFMMWMFPLSAVKYLNHKYKLEPLFCSTGFIPLPLSVILGVATNQPESASAHSRRQGCPLYPAFLALHKAAEKIRRRDHRMRSMRWRWGHDT